MRARTTLLLCLLFLIAGCISVKKFGAYWDSGKPDPTLEGRWDSVRADKGGAGVSFGADGDIYRMRFDHDTDDQFVRTLAVGESTYLMVKKKEGDEGGTMIAYVQQGEDLVLFAPNRDKQKDFLKKYPTIPFVITKTSFTIEELTPETMKWLIQISSEPEWWIAMQSFKRAQ